MTGLSVRINSQLHDLRPRRQVRPRGPNCHPINGINPVQLSYQSPWQNGIAERRVSSCPHHLLDQVIALNEQHLKRLLADYVRYYHEDRTHLGFGQTDSESSDLFVHSWSGDRKAETRRPASSLRTGSLTQSGHNQCPFYARRSQDRAPRSRTRARVVTLRRTADD